MKHPMSALLRSEVPRILTNDQGGEFMARLADELDRQHRAIAILSECILATRNPSMNRVYSECDVQDILTSVSSAASPPARP